MNRTTYAGLLYSQPSFWEGFARVLDIGGTFDAYADSATEAEADRLATLSDWYAVGADLNDATRDYCSRAGLSGPDRTDG